MKMSQDKQAKRIQRLGWGQPNHLIQTPALADRGASKRMENQSGLPVEKKGVVPIFFATDDNYLPFLSVTLQSLRENSSLDYDYKHLHFTYN